jgi:hypothetical protein
MVRGGSRQGAGRKSTWASGCNFKDTTLIRVPSRLASILLEVAHKIDAGEVIDFATKSDSQESKPVISDSVIDNTQSQKKNDFVTESENLPDNIGKGKENDSVTKSENLSDKGQQPFVVHEAKDLEKPIQLELSVKSFELTEPNLRFNLESLFSTPIPGKLLAHRLGVGVVTLSKKKSTVGFYDWLQKKDPDDIRWRAAGGLKGYSKGYLPSENTSPDKLKKLQEWLDKNK